jgi:hypothetical protein
MRKVDLTGQRFGRLVALEMLRGGGDARVRCACDCGAEATPLAYNLRNGNTSSCGCLLREKAAERGRHMGPIMGAANRIHGMKDSPTYARWQDAKKRCYSLQNKRFALYGGRGIVMCERWRNSFVAFLSDMGECPPKHTLERLDNDKGYEPGNCVWATREQQAQNRRCNKATPEIVRQIRSRSAEGESYAALARVFAMSHSNVKMIVSRATWRNVA